MYHVGSQVSQKVVVIDLNAEVTAGGDWSVDLNPTCAAGQQ
jgi:hypothetical protein